MSINIRPLQQTDAGPVLALCAAVQPERVRDLKVYLRRFEEPERELPESLRQWIAVDAAEQCIGYAACWNVVRRKYRMDLLVHPDGRRQHIGSHLLHAILAALHATSAATLQARTWDDWSESLQFLQRRGFAEIHQMVELRLDLREADFTAQHYLLRRLIGQGIEFTTLEREGADEQFWAKLTDLQCAALADWPDPDPDGEPMLPTEAEIRRQFAAWRTTPDTFFLAKSGGQLLGYTVLGLDPGNPQAIGTGPTAVRLEFRGRGIATALKVLALYYAREQGWQAAATRSANPAMIRVNEKLGFQRGRAEVRLVKRLDTNDQP